MTILDSIRSAESPDALYLILDDVDAKKVMIAWTLVPHHPFMDRERKKNESLDLALSDLWTQVAVDMDELTKASELPLQVTVLKFNRLKKIKLVYPDGSVPSEARKLIRSEINSYRINLVPKGYRAQGVASPQPKL